MKLIVFLLIFGTRIAVAASCADWFAKIPLRPTDKNCISKCTTAAADMSSFGCTSECENLCFVPTASGSILGMTSSMYPGINSEEKKMIQKYPKESFRVFLIKFKAESLSTSWYPEGGIDDEQDASRHFLWAGFLLNELGVDKAKEFLDAHEKTVSQRPDSRAMDLANNRAGLLASEKLLKEGKFSEGSLIQELKIQMRKGNLSILKPTETKK